jgi:hypothetical protein
MATVSCGGRSGIGASRSGGTIVLCAAILATDYSPPDGRRIAESRARLESSYRGTILAEAVHAGGSFPPTMKQP